MIKTKLFTLTLLALGQTAVSAQPMGATSPIQQIPQIPTQRNRLPEIRIERPNESTTPLISGAEIRVNALRVTGQTQYSESELIAATGFAPGSMLRLADLRTMANRIAAYYTARGYLVAQAYLPAQDIKDGVVKIAVIEGRYDQITLRNQSSLSESVANNLLADVKTNDPVRNAPLERALLLLSDVPGVEVNSTIKPGALPGTSDLVVDITPGRRVTGYVEADNEGNRYTGENRIGAMVNLNNPTGHGDVASLHGLTSGEGLNYLRASYQTQIGQGTVGVAYAEMHYRLGREFEILQANGTVKVASLYGSYPLIRSRSKNLYARVDYDDKSYKDRVDSTFSVTDKHARVITTSLIGDQSDSLGAGGISAYTLAWSTGELSIDTPAARLLDDASAQTGGHFDKLAFNVMRVQNLGGPLSLYAAIKGQVASKNLDASEKMELGGAHGVRAYPQGEAYADEGYVATLEARLQLPSLLAAQSGQLQLVGFVDAGRVTVDRKPWLAGPNDRTLSAAGLGLTWTESKNFMAKAYYARKLGTEPATSAPDQAGRFWIQLVKYF